MKKNVGLLMVLLLSLIFLSCGSSDAEIISYSLDGATLVGVPVIDLSARTVAVTVEPVDLSKVAPSVTVSTGATYTADELVDGEAVNYTVTAENGSKLEWTVTVTVSPGVSFTYGTTSVALMKGLIDSEDDVHNSELGDGEPVGIYKYSESYNDSENTVCISYENNYYDKGGSEGEPEDGKCYIRFSGVDEAGNRSALLEEFRYEYSSESSYANIEMSSELDVTFYISDYGSVSGYIQGTFSCPDVSYEGEEVSGPVAITNGFLKVLRLADDYIIDKK